MGTPLESKFELSYYKPPSSVIDSSEAEGIINTEGIPARIKKKRDLASEISLFLQYTGLLCFRGHTGREPVKLPFPVGCTTPVLGGL